jgi:hypothetical protein
MTTVAGTRRSDDACWCRRPHRFQSGSGSPLSQRWIIYDQRQGPPERARVLSDAWRAAVALRAPPVMEVRPVGAIDMPAVRPLALESPDLLVVVGPFERGLPEQALLVPVQVLLFGHLLVPPEPVPSLRSADPVVYSCSALR